MSRETGPKCDGRTDGWADGWADGEFHSCGNGGTIKRGDLNFCWQHDPEGQAKRDAADRKRSENMSTIG